MKSNKVLVTGGAGYIGSHTVVQLLNADFKVTILDNLSNSNPKSLDRIAEITEKTVEFINGDILDHSLLEQIFKENKYESVIHFAGLKSVSESEEFPDRYFATNVTGTENLISAMTKYDVNKLVFSSSATVYGDPGYAECSESTPVNPVSYYGKTKLDAENLIKKNSEINSEFKYAILRYFNPVGAHASGKIGEDPNGIPNNLLPFVSQVAVGKREKVFVWGNDYPTPDGTGKRDYIHVEDLAAGHLAALEFLDKSEESITVNLGTGNSYSVLEVIEAFAKSSTRAIPYEIVARRTGDVAENFADPTLAKEKLGWSAIFNLDQMCADAWRWQSKNPNGYAE